MNEKLFKALVISSIVVNVAILINNAPPIIEMVEDGVETVKQKIRAKKRKKEFEKMMFEA